MKAGYYFVATKNMLYEDCIVEGNEEHVILSYYNGEEWDSPLVGEYDPKMEIQFPSVEEVHYENSDDVYHYITRNPQDV